MKSKISNLLHSESYGLRNIENSHKNAEKVMVLGIRVMVKVLKFESLTNDQFDWMTKI